MSILVTCKYCKKTNNKNELQRHCCNCFCCTGCEIYICANCGRLIEIIPIEEALKNIKKRDSNHL